MRRLLLSLLVVLGLAAGAGFSRIAAAAEFTGPQPVLPQSQLIIHTAKGPVHFTVEMATSWPQQEQGLMFRRSLAPDAGMLFDFVTEQEEAFWMKNTLIPLDMVFIKADGRIARIAANAKPLSEQSVPSYEPVRAVLEIAGGRAAALGLKPGDRVENPIFKARTPAPAAAR